MMYRFTPDYELIEHRNYSDLIDSTFDVETTDKVKPDTKDTTTVGDLKEQESQEKRIVSLKNN